MKTTDNHPLNEIDRLIKPATSTMIDRYIFVKHKGI